MTGLAMIANIARRVGDWLVARFAEPVIRGMLAISGNAIAGLKAGALIGG